MLVLFMSTCLFLVGAFNLYLLYNFYLSSEIYKGYRFIKLNKSKQFWTTDSFSMSEMHPPVNILCHGPLLHRQLSLRRLSPPMGLPSRRLERRRAALKVSGRNSRLCARFITALRIKVSSERVCERHTNSSRLTLQHRFMGHLWVEEHVMEKNSTCCINYFYHHSTSEIQT